MKPFFNIFKVSLAVFTMRAEEIATEMKKCFRLKDMLNFNVI